MPLPCVCTAKIKESASSVDLAHPSVLNRAVPWRWSVTLIWVRPRLDWTISVQWSHGVGKLLDRDCDPTPDSHPSGIAFPLLASAQSAETRPSGEAPRHAEAIRLGLVGVAIDHQQRDTPDLDFG
jgi:hypothetical protein